MLIMLSEALHVWQTLAVRAGLAITSDKVDLAMLRCRVFGGFQFHNSELDRPEAGAADADTACDVVAMQSSSSKCAGWP